MEKLVICSIMIFAIVGINISLFTDESNKQEREYFYKKHIGRIRLIVNVVQIFTHESSFLDYVSNITN